MHVQWWWLVVGALVLLLGEGQDKQWAAAALAALGVVWALTTHGTTVIIVALGFAIGVWTAAAWKYLSQPEKGRQAEEERQAADSSTHDPEFLMIEPKGKVIHMNRLLKFSVMVIAILALAGTATAADTKTASINAKLTPTSASGGGWCCGSYLNFSGRTTIAPLGSLSFVGYYEKGSSSSGCYYTTDGGSQSDEFRVLDLTLVAGNGDKLVLHEGITWTVDCFNFSADPPQAWTVDQAASTGKFATYTGSGSYAWTSAPLRLTLSGTLSWAK